jgi:hypothetical protein
MGQSNIELLSELVIESESKIVFLIADGLGGLPQHGKLERRLKLPLCESSFLLQRVLSAFFLSFL